MPTRYTWRDCAVTLAVQGAAASLLTARVGELLALPAEDVDAPPDLTAQALPDGGWRLTWGECRQTLADLDDLLLLLLAQMSQLFAQRTRYLLLHAAACAQGEAAVLFAGPSRVGKSTLMLAAWRAGHTLLADDLLAVDPETRQAMTFPKAMKPRLAERRLPTPAERLPGTQRLVGELNGEYRLLLGRGLPGMAAHDQSFRLGRLYLVARAASGPSRVATLERDTALRGLLAQVLTTRGAAPMEGVRLLKDWWSRGEVQRLWLGENDQEGAVALTLPVG